MKFALNITNCIHRNMLKNLYSETLSEVQKNITWGIPLVCVCVMYEWISLRISLVCLCVRYEWISVRILLVCLCVMYECICLMILLVCVCVIYEWISLTKCYAWVGNSSSYSGSPEFSFWPGGQVPSERFFLAFPPSMYWDNALK